MVEKRNVVGFMGLMGYYKFEENGIITLNDIIIKIENINYFDWKSMKPSYISTLKKEFYKDLLNGNN